MPLALLRVRAARTVLALLLLGSVVSGPMVLRHVDPLGDEVCETSLDVSQAPRVAASHDTHSRHCDLCHLVRSCCSIEPGSARLDAIADTLAVFRQETASRADCGSWTLLPGRAPPASFLPDLQV